VVQNVGVTLTPIRLDAHNPGPMTGSGNHTYLIPGAGGCALLVDAGVGHPEHLKALRAALADRDATLGTVFVTHAHGDHISGVEALAAEWPDARFVKHPWPEEDATHNVVWHPVHDGDRFAVDGGTLVALRTPGHSPDHLVLWHEASRTAFTGDLVVADSSVMIQWTRGGDLAQYLTSLERLLALRPARLFPAHGAEVHDSETLVRGYIAHRLMRERQIVAALEAGRDTVTAIAGSIYDGLAPALMPAAHETVRAHLEKLKQERRAVEDDGRWRRLPT
jgi:ribonuclease/clavin/mitogillin